MATLRSHGDDTAAIDKNPNMEKNKEICSVPSKPSQILEGPVLILAMTAAEREKAEAALRRKIDLRLMPMIVLIYIMNYLDRNNIAAARLAGMEEELNLSSTEYLVGITNNPMAMEVANKLCRQQSVYCL